MENITVVLANTRFPENVGMTARACANMGVKRLRLCAPERWDAEKAAPLATPKGRPVLDDLEVFASLPEALDGHALIVGATARAGGWRQNMAAPRAEAASMARAAASGAPVALLLGSEDRGLTNEQIMLCHDLVRIPTVEESSSLNLAQAALIILYECFTAANDLARAAAARQGEGRPSARGSGAELEACSELEAGSELEACSELEAGAGGCVAPDAARQESGMGGGAGALAGQVAHADYERLMSSFKAALLHMDFLHGGNPDYFFMPLRRFFARKGLKRHEYDAFMGICRQIMRLRDPRK